MVQLSPMTEYGSGAGYEYEDSVILSFTHTNKGHWNLCNIPVLPVSGNGSLKGSRFSHQREAAEPGYYQVYLNDYQVDVKLTSTLRCGFHQYNFNIPKTAASCSTWPGPTTGYPTGRSSRPGKTYCRVTSKRANGSISMPS